MVAIKEAILKLRNLNEHYPEYAFITLADSATLAAYKQVLDMHESGKAKIDEANLGLITAFVERTLAKIDLIEAQIDKRSESNESNRYVEVPTNESGFQWKQ